MVSGKAGIAGGALAACVALAGKTAAWTPCGPEGALCAVDEGSYALLLPDTSMPPPIFVYLHGYAGHAKGAACAKALTEPVLARGYAFLAPEGQVDLLQGKNLDWGVRDTFTWKRDDQAFVARAIEDAAARFGLDRDRVVIAGYSRGGSMAWDLACAQPGLAAGFASFAGGFWEPARPECAGPVHLFHRHGFSDRTVPLEGQRGTWQGQPYEMVGIAEGFGIWRQSLGCRDKASAIDTGGATWTKLWDDCKAGSIRFTLGPGGHKRPADWAREVLDWFAALPG